MIPPERATSGALVFFHLTMRTKGFSPLWG